MLRKGVLLRYTFFMMKNISTLTFCIVAVLMICTSSVAQTEAVWQDLVVEYVELNFSEESKPDIEQMLEDLEFAAKNPLHINSASFDEFSKLYLLNPIQIQNLISYRETYGSILSPFELKTIDGFDENLIRLIAHFLVFDETESDTIRYQPKQDFIVRAIQLLEKQKGYKQPKKYEGSRLKLYSRYRFSSKTIHAGFTAEKDAGESFFQKSNSKGFDFYSGFAAVTFPKKNHQLFLGDYRLQFGQGLTAWHGFTMGKSVDINAGAKFNQGIAPYTSTDENNFMRGIAAKFKSGRISIFPFYSFKKFDANTDSIDNKVVFTSFQTSGLHRTSSEIEDKNSIKEQTTGAYLIYSKKFYSIGLTGIHTNYSKPLKRSDSKYNQYLFEGNDVSNYSIDYKIGLNKYFIFGELAGSSTNGYAYTGGLLAKPFDKIEFTSIYRNIGRKYNAPHGNAFIENSKLNDEEGLYLGLKILPLPKVRIQGYADFFKYKWIKYTTVAPGRGKEFQLQFNYQISLNWNIYSRYFYEIKPVKTTINSVKINFDQHREKLRFHLNGDINDNFFVRSRVEFMFYSHDHKSDGLLAFQDFGFTSEKLNSTCWLRISYFNTDDYDSRVYAYENDLLYQFSIPSFYGEGVRSYLNGKVKICEKTNLWIKASRTWFFNTESLGSGYNMIEGNKRTELKLQLRFRF